ncbi:hypothetical protein OJF2_75710 [Aquisphaera giovannonii]|uniref:Uncharacterized protein n=1 Tax=Aquisphaera giovannonii TaxID=406548 RepID=A0A5B9WG29_9BACT|nr:hypothetical protein [Aquisphaera giovannonii]QEH38961.1 hypothetical protein OJF2_75710 [Aquisphaera giovannonii]
MGLIPAIEVMILISSASVLGLLAVVWGWIAWDRAIERRRERLKASKRERYSLWHCPDCGRPFGPDVLWQSTSLTLSVAGRSATQPIEGDVICCPHCRLCNRFDEAGNATFEKGFFFDLYERKRESERWDDIMPHLACPLCRGGYRDWASVLHDEIDGYQGTTAIPMRCPHCAVDAKVIQREGKPQFVAIRRKGEGWEALDDARSTHPRSS